jgi:hypothetical protein
MMEGALPLRLACMRMEVGFSRGAQRVGFGIRRLEAGCIDVLCTTEWEHTTRKEEERLACVGWMAPACARRSGFSRRR